MSANAVARLAARRAIRFAAVCLVTAGLADASAAEAPPDPSTASAPLPAWALRLPAVDKVVFHGAVSYDAAGMGTASFLYPAPGPIGLLAAVVTHGAITYGARERQKDQMQKDADLVLAPYQPVLAAFTHRQLIEAALLRLPAGPSMRLLGAADPADREPLIETAPVFSLTQDQRALVLDNIVRIFAAGGAQPVYAQTIRVVSVPLASPAASTSTESGDAAAAVAALWLDSQGRRLTDQSAAMFAESIDIALADSAGALGDPAAPHKTFRYAEGGRERMERAQFVADRCDHTVIRSLRGWLMAVPAAGVAGAAPTCAAGARAN